MCVEAQDFLEDAKYSLPNSECSVRSDWIKLKNILPFLASIVEYLYHRYKKDILIDIFRNKIYFVL